MLPRKSQRIARRTLTEEDRWLDLEVALEDDCVEALQIKMDFHEIDVHMTHGFEVKWSVVKDGKCVEQPVTIHKSALNLAVDYGAVNCVAYLMEIGARSRDRLPGSGYDFAMKKDDVYDFDIPCLGYAALHWETWDIKEEEAKERWSTLRRPNTD